MKVSFTVGLIFFLVLNTPFDVKNDIWDSVLEKTLSVWIVWVSNRGLDSEKDENESNDDLEIPFVPVSREVWTGMKPEGEERKPLG